LRPGEAEALLAACRPSPRALVEALLETGCRKGELLSLTWGQIEGMQVDGPAVTWTPKATMFLPARKTKTKTARRIPISSRLRAIWELRRLDPAGQPLPLDAFVFGTAVGDRVGNVDRAWREAVLKAHGVTPQYTQTGNLTAASRAALKTIDLHLHDLRREAGSRWLDGGMPLHAARDLLGRSNVSQTSTYLATTATSLHDAMARFESACNARATDARPGGHDGSQTATGEDERPNETAVGRNQPLM
jgi:integrase